MSSETRVFQPIPRSAERDLILLEFAMNSAEVFIKFTEQSTLLSKAKAWKAPFKLQLTYPSSPRPLVQKQVPVQVNFRGDRYFMMAFVQDTGTEFYLVIEGPLYKVQRRQSFRLKLPSDYPAVVHAFELNGLKTNTRCKILDLSEGGCSLLVPAHLACQMGSHIGLRLKMGPRDEFMEYGHITYSKFEKDQIRLGIRFIRPAGSDSALFTLVRDLYVELFSKWSRRK
jgi:hypothetical protein